MIDDAAIRSGLLLHLKRKLGPGVDIVRFSKLSPGFSWITFRLSASVERGPEQLLIARVAPAKGLFAPYSVLPQVYAFQALAGSGVPVPALVSYSEEGAETGAPFFLCSFVAGETPAPWAASSLDEEHRRSIAGQFIDILGRIHRFAWRGSVLAELDGARDERPELAPIAMWRAAVARPAGRYYPTLDWGGRWLAANCPRAAQVTLIHGDYRIGNFLEERGRIVAILDWELVHVGDPHEDLAWALLPTFNGGSQKFYGVMERDEFLDRYQRASGVEVSRKTLAFYEAFALYQAAAIQLRGVQAFEIDRFPDMRLCIMSSQMASIVRAFDRAIEAAS